MSDATTIINLIILALNVGVLGLCLKLYTEYFKDKSISAKKAEVVRPADREGRA